MRNTFLRYFLAPAALVWAAAGAADADLMLTINVPPGTEVFAFSDGTGPAGGGQFSALNGFQAYVGPLSGNFSGGGAFTTYCVNLFKDISPGSTYGVNPAAPTALAGHDTIGNLLALSPTTPAQGAALQFAVWDAEYLGGRDVGQDGGGVRFGAAAGGFLVTGPGTGDGSLAALINGYLHAAAGQVGTGHDFTFLAVPDDQYGQSMVAAVGPGMPTVAAVPEPSTLAGAALAGLMGLGYAWRRRRAA